MLSDSQSKGENILKAAQELNESFDVILAHSQYQIFLDNAMRVFIKFLQKGTPHIIAEVHIQQVKKLILEMIQRFPANDLFRPHAKSIRSLTRKLGTLNSENWLLYMEILSKVYEHFQQTEKEDKNSQQFQHWKTELQKHLDKPLVQGDVYFLVNSNWVRPMKKYV